MDQEQEKPKQEPEKDNGGIWVELGDKQYKIPPLNFKALKELQSALDSLQKVSAIPSAEQLNGMLDIAHRAIKRNYPHMTADDFSEMIDMGNIRTVLSAIMNVPGARKLSPGEKPNP